MSLSSMAQVYRPGVQVGAAREPCRSDVYRLKLTHSPPMKLIHEIRLRNARSIMTSHGQGLPSGSKSAMAMQMGLARQVVGFYLADTKETGAPRKQIGDEMARKFESIYGKPRGWMDHDHDCLDEARQDDETIDAPAMAIDGEGDQAMRLTRLSKLWLRSNTSVNAQERLATLSASGDSMAPTFGDGAILLVDRGVNAVKSEAVYVLAIGGEAYVKRVARRPDGGVLLLSDNKAYPPMPIDDPGAVGMTVLGRVVLAWNAVKL